MFQKCWCLLLLNSIELQLLFKPAEILLKDEKGYLIGKRESFEDLIKNQVVVEV
jgi:hypothetical protein